MGGWTRLAAGLLLLGLAGAGCAAPAQRQAVADAGRCALAENGPGGLEDLVVPSPATDLVVLYSFGGNQSGTADRCRVPGGVPPLMHDLDRRPGVVLKANCDTSFDQILDAREAERERPCGWDGGAFAAGGHIKVCGRSRRIIACTEALLRRNPGLTPERVFWAGHSTGAWASLLAQSFRPDLASGVVAFAPAFAGLADGRSRDREDARKLHMGWLTGRAALPAVVFAFERDPYETPRALAPLHRPAAGSRLCAAPPPGRACSGFIGSTHNCHERDWFSGEYLDGIAGYLAGRTDVPGRCAGG
jgi:pimeloyl-ACP methyl ester carboxylesterase